MATSAPPPPVPLDEMVFHNPSIIEWWQSGQHGILPPPFPSMDERMLHRYFSESPFFDWTSINGLLLEQSKTDVQLWQRVHDRIELERQLARGVGSSYVLTGVPAEVQVRGTQAPAVKESSAVYNIRKQLRQRDREGRETLETTGSYYAVGEKVFQAPSVADVVGNRLLAATASLSKFFDRAKGLHDFAPTTGYTSLPLHVEKRAVAGSVGNSRQASPAPGSREGSALPETQSLRSTSVPPDGQSGNALNGSSAEEARHARLLVQSLTDCLQYADEYMDENPLLGQPGSFTFTSSSAFAASKKRKADDEREAAATAEAASKAAATAAAAARNLSADGKDGPAQQAEDAKPVEPPAVFMQAKANAKVERDKERRGSRISEKAKRRKSRPANAAQSTAVTTPNPTTAGAGTNAAASGSAG